MNGMMLGLVAFVLFAVTTAHWFRLALSLRHPQNRTPWVMGWAGAVLLGGAAFSQSPGLIGGITAGLAMSAGAFLLFTIGISRQQVAPDAVTLGAQLPAFDAIDDAGESFALASLAGGPLLLKFFRGHW
jgi:hypothetical protein